MKSKIFKILIVRKMSALEYYYNGRHKSKKLKKSKAEQDSSIRKIEQILKREKQRHKTIYKIITRKQLTEKFVSSYDFVFSAGGDGTVIATAAYNKKIPQLNLKIDKRSKGKLCQKNIEKAILAILNKKYRIEKWTRQDIYLNKRFIGRALNETCVGENLKFSKMAKYEIFFSGRKEKHKNSGLIIATGTGSTGWPGAFSYFSKESKIFKFRTILAYKGKSEYGEGKYFKIIYKGHEGKFAIDTIEHDLPRDSILEIKISKNPLLVVVPN